MQPSLQRTHARPLQRSTLGQVPDLPGYVSEAVCTDREAKAFEAGKGEAREDVVWVVLASVVVSAVAGAAVTWAWKNFREL